MQLHGGGNLKCLIQKNKYELGFFPTQYLYVSFWVNVNSKSLFEENLFIQGLMGEAGLIPVLQPNTRGRSRCVYLTLGERLYTVLLPNGYRRAQMDVFNETGLKQRKLFS